MTIGSTTIQTSGSTGNGATTQFSFSFNLDPDGYGATTAASQVQVIRETISSGAEEVLTLNTHYTVSVNADQGSSPGGSITMLSAPSSAYKIWIRLNPDFTQQTDYQNQGGFLMETVEDQADQHTRQILALKDMARRAPRVGVQAGPSFDGEITGDLTAGYVPMIKPDLSGWQLGAPFANLAESQWISVSPLTYVPEDAGGATPSVNLRRIDGDNLDAGSGFIIGDQSRYVFGGSNVKGGRIAHYSFVANTVATNSGNTNRNYVAENPVAYTAVGDGGTNTGSGAKGGYFPIGSQGFLDGAQNVVTLVNEMDTFVKTGSSVRYLGVLSLVGGNRVRGAEVDAAMWVSGATSTYGDHIGWNHGILFTDINGVNPFYSGSVLIGSYWQGATPTIDKGVDLSGFTITTVEFKSTGFQVDGAGNQQAKNDGQVLISRQAASSSATIDFTGLSSTYDRYILQVCSAKPATDDVALELRVGTGAGPSYQTSNYYWGNTNMRGNTTFAGGSASDVALFVSGLSGGGAGVGNAAGENIQTTIEFSNPDSADFMQVSWRSTFMRADGTPCTVVGGGCYNVAGAITAVQLLFSSGNIASGDFILLGVRHAN